MKRISIFFTAVLLYGCLSVISKNSENNLIIDEILIPTAQCNMCVANIENALSGVDGIFDSCYCEKINNSYPPMKNPLCYAG